LQEQLEEVERALRKMDEGTYGLCENCGKEIAQPRLEAIPTARFCIDCASSRA
jgi:RNA polymerase-binding protein DksA